MVDFGESDKMIKMNGEVDKSNIYNGFFNISFFLEIELHQNSDEVLFIIYNIDNVVCYIHG